MEQLFENGIVPTADIMRNLLRQKKIHYTLFSYPSDFKIDHGDLSEFDRLAGVSHG